MDITIFVSCEPLLESIDLSKYINELDWVIVGGERANKKGRVMEFEYVRNIYILCKKSNTPFFFKQWGDCEKAVKDSLVSDDLALTKEIENTKGFSQINLELHSALASVLLSLDIAKEAFKNRK